MNTDNSATPWLPTLQRHMRSFEVRRYQECAGLTADEAVPWADASIFPQETATALRNGQTIAEALTVRHARPGEPTVAEAWEQAGIGRVDAKQLMAAGFSLLQAIDLQALTPAIGGPEIVWGVWDDRLVAIDRMTAARVRNRLRIIRALKSATSWLHIPASVPAEEVEFELGPLLDQAWVEQWKPAQGEDVCPPRPKHWRPAGRLTLADEWRDERHPIELIGADAIAFDIASINRQSLGWLWTDPDHLLQLAQLAADHDSVLVRDQHMIDEILRGVRP